MHTTIARVIALAAATLLVVPATALARGGHDDPAPAAAVVPAGQDDQTSETEGAGQSTDGAALEHAGGDDASPGADDSAGTGQEGAHGHGRHGRRSQDVRASKRFDLRGTVISADASGSPSACRRASPSSPSGCATGTRTDVDCGGRDRPAAHPGGVAGETLVLRPMSQFTLDRFR